jgi:Pectate lyase superfamily protein
MTIQNTTLRKAGPSQGNGVTTVFPFTFKVFTDTDILVTYLNALGVESVLVLSTNYTVALNVDQNASPGGSVTLLVAPATATYITLTSQVTNTQTLALTNSGGFYPESINNALDRTVIEIQQLAEQASRSIAIPKSSTASPLLPTPTANNVLVWNNAATALINLPAATGTSLVNLAASTGSTLVGTTNGGTGSVTRTVASKINDVISVKDFGAVGNGITDDTAAVQAAIDSLGTAGGTIIIPDGCSLYIASNLTINANVALKGQFSLTGVNGDNINYPLGLISAVTLNSSATITLMSGAGVDGIFIYKSGLTFPQNNASAFAGTAFTAGGNDVFIRNSMILGFAQAFYSTGHSRARIDKVYIDCQAGIEITACYDVCRLTDIHCWPFVTYAGTGTQARHNRTGSAFYLHDGNDGPMLSNCFAYGYLNGFYFKTVSTIAASNCYADNTLLHPDSAGWRFETTINGFNSSGCAAWGADYGVISTLPTNSYLKISGFKMASNAIAGIYITDAAQIHISDNMIGYSPYAIYTNSQFGGIYVNNNEFDTISTTPISGSVVNYGSNISDTNLYSGGFNSNITAPAQFLSSLITCATNLTIASKNTFYTVTGAATPIVTIINGWQGRQITIKFLTIYTITNSIGTNCIRLTGSTNMTSGRINIIINT